jgi:hypothetical protein
MEDVKTEKSAGKNRGFGSFFFKTVAFGSVNGHNTYDFTGRLEINL